MDLEYGRRNPSLVVIVLGLVSSLGIGCDSGLKGARQTLQSTETRQETPPAPSPTPTPVATPTPMPTSTPVGPTKSIDAIINEMPSNSWRTLPGTLMKDVCPTPYHAGRCAAVMGAWSGGAYDEKRDRLIVMGGGHGDSWYNNVFAFDLGSMRWLRLSDMPPGAGDVPPPGWKDHRIERCGYYPKGPLNIPDGMIPNGELYVDRAKCFEEPILSQLDFQQPRSAHTYGRVFHDRLKDRYCYFPLGTYPGAQAQTMVVNCFNPVRGLWERVADRPDNVGGRGQTALDSKGNIWAITDSSGPIGEFDPIKNEWRTYGSLNYSAGGGMDIDRKRNHAYVLFPLADESYSIRRFDLNSLETLKLREPFSEIPTTGDQPKNLRGRPGFVYADKLDQFFAWGGGRTVYVLDPATSVWRVRVATGDDPGEQAQRGTYGRFRYSPNRGVFILVNSTATNVSIYKP